MPPASALSLYLHLPFCHHVCSYCDLNAYAGLNHLMPRYVQALVKEIHAVSGKDQPLHSIYLGGGTPSLVPLDLLSEIFVALRAAFELTPDCEISFEVNPEDAIPAYLAGLRELGINRLSLGVQSAKTHELQLFTRTHTFADVVAAMQNMRAAGFDNLSVDLIFGIPEQTLASWQETLQRTLDLEPDHFSVYSLSLDFGTPLRAWVQRGLVPAPNDDWAADMYLWADEELARHGFAQYEISSWAKKPAANNQQPSTECRHNLQYWHNQPYLGLGAGAHGYVRGDLAGFQNLPGLNSESKSYRYANVRSPTAYINRMEHQYLSFRAKREISTPDKEIPRGYAARNDNTPPSFPFSPALNESLVIDRKTEMDETMLTGLRLTQEGVKHKRFSERFGVELDNVYAKDLKELTRKGLIESDQEQVRLTKEGRLVANWVFEKFV